MRKYIFLFIMLISAATVTLAQHKSSGNEDRIKALKIAYITEKLELTPESSKVFWPVYNEYHQKKSKAKKNYHPSKDIYEMNETESVQYVKNCLQADKDLLELNIKFHEDLKSILSPQQIARLHAAEWDFKKKILKSIREKDKDSKRRMGDDAEEE